MVRSAVVVLVSLFSLAGCTAQSMPGTPLGTFAATGTLTSNTCGSGLDLDNPWTFTAQLSRDGSMLYMMLAGNPSINATIDSNDDATFSTSAALSWDNAVDASACAQAENSLMTQWSQQTPPQCTSPGSCDVTRADTLAITLASKSFTGTETSTYSAASGFNCSDELSAQGGPFDTLPCTVTYSISATLDP
jgi:hypothetical protein